MRTLTLPLITLLSALAALPCQAGNPTIFYVDDDAPAVGADGQSWQTAFTYLQDALSAAAPFAGTPVEIRVAQGVYRPDQGAGVVLGDRDATFELLSSTTLRGGYRGLGGIVPSEPGTEGDNDPELFVTRLDGDLLGNDGPGFTGRDDNSYSILFVQLLSTDIVMDGLEIVNGDAGSPFFGEPASRRRGGGLFCYGDRVVVNKCNFYNNRAYFVGGAIEFRPGTLAPELSIFNCKFISNHSFGPSGQSGAVFVSSSDARIVNCVFAGNSATNNGGALSRSPTVNNDGGAGTGHISGCLFVGNEAGAFGGAVYADQTIVANCTFVDNTGGGDLPPGNPSGGAIWIFITDMFNCVFDGNEGQGVSDAVYIRNLKNSPVSSLSHSIFMGGPTSIETEGAVVGPALLYPDPKTTTLFADPLGPDGLPSTGDEDYRLAFSSPAIDSGNSDAVPRDIDDLDNDGVTNEAIPFDLDRTSRLADVPGVPDTGVGEYPIVDMGAYEIDACEDCPGDRTWQNLAGGSFSDQSSWFPGTPGIGNTTVFDLDATYTVTLDSNIETHSLRAERGLVTLDLDGYEYELNAFAEPPLVIGSGAGDLANLTFRDGLLLSEGGVIGKDSGASGTLVFDGAGSPVDWVSQQDLVVGSGGDGALRIENGAFVTSPGGAIGQLPGASGAVTIQGAGSEWSVPFGVQVINGALTVRDGAALTAQFFGIAVRSDGTVGGNSVINADLLNFGVVRPDDAIGAAPYLPLTINGDYEQVQIIPLFDSNLGSLEFSVESLPASPDQAPFVINGDAMLGGAAVVDFMDLDTLAAGQRYPLLRAGSFMMGSEFNVAYFQGFFDEEQDDLFMSLEYITGARGSLTSGVDVLVNTLDATSTIGDPIGAGSVGAPPASAAVGDLDSDGFDDLVVVIPGSLIIYINADTPGGGWDGYTQLLPIGIGNNPVAVTIGDLDGNSLLDVVVIDADNNEASVYLDVASASGPAGVTPLAGLLTAPTGALLGDFTGDGIDELVVIGDDPVAPAGDGVAVALGYSSGSSQFDASVHSASVGRGPVFSDTSDLDQDKDLDLAVVNTIDGTVSVLMNLGQDMGGWIGLGNRTDLNVGDQPVWLAIGDLDQDGPMTPDLFVANAASNNASVILGAGSGEFLPASSIPIGTSPGAIALADLDQDANNDLDVAVIVNEAGSSVIRILRNDLDAATGQLAFSQTLDLQEGSAPRIVFAGNLDGAGSDDLISVNDQSELPLQQRGAPGVMDIEALLTVFPVLCAADINGDGVVDTADLGILIGQFGQSGPGAQSDVNGDDVVDTADLGILIGEFGSICN